MKVTFYTLASLFSNKVRFHVVTTSEIGTGQCVLPYVACSFLFLRCPPYVRCYAHSPHSAQRGGVLFRGTGITVRTQEGGSTTHPTRHNFLPLTNIKHLKGTGEGSHNRHRHCTSTDKQAGHSDTFQAHTEAEHDQVRPAFLKFWRQLFFFFSRLPQH